MSEAASALVTVGTDHAWAPPKVVRLAVNDDLVVSNLDPVTWDIVDRGRITRAAIRVRGEWCGLDIALLEVERGQAVTLPAGAISIVLDLVPIDVGAREIESAERPELTP